MPLNGHPRDWREGSKQAYFRDFIAADGGASLHTPVECPTCDRVIAAALPKLGTFPVVFRRKINGVWFDRPDGEQRLKHYVYEVHQHVVDAGHSANGHVVTSEPKPKPEPTPVVTPVIFDVEAEKRFFMVEFKRLQTFAEDREIDSLKYRPVQDARRMIEVGICAIACIHAMTLHWEDATRRQASVKDYCLERDFPGGRHAYMDKLAEAGVLIMLIGPAGVGKSYWAKSLADRLNLAFGSIPMTEGASPSWLLGKETLNGYKESPFVQIWRDSGVFLFDEIDAADANMLLVANDALANGTLHNPVSGLHIPKGDRVIVVATANTMGDGADADYAGRNQLDFATLDRFRMGRVLVDFDQTTADNLMFA